MDRVVLITGGTGALGGAVTRAFLDDGATVAVTYRNGAEYERLSASAGAGDRLRGYATDVTDASSVRDSVGRVEGELGPIAALVHVAGGYFDATTVATTTDETWELMMNLNLRSAFVCARAVLPGMAERRGGKIVTVSSRAALRVFPGVGAYAASKAGLIALTEVIAAEGAESNVQANVVLPSIIDTAVNRKAMPDVDPSTWVRPEELASVILFLCSPAADRISGASIPVYGRA